MSSVFFVATSLSYNFRGSLCTHPFYVLVSMFVSVKSSNLYVVKGKIIKFLKKNDNWCKLSFLEQEICNMGYTLTEVIEAYNHLTFEDRITCNGEIIILVA